MVKVDVKFKMKEGGIPPKQGLKGDFGTDLYLNEDVIIIPTALEATLAGTGVHTEFDPEEFGMLLTLRSSMSKLPISMANHVGVIEGTYRGELLIPLRNTLNTRNLGEVNAEDYVLVWEESEKKLVKLPSDEVPNRLHKQVYEQLSAEIDLVGGNGGHLEYSTASKLLPRGTVLIKRGTRVAQAYMVNRNEIKWQEVGDLSKTERGSGGFGSTNKKENV